jgi:hypothetical protein
MEPLVAKTLVDLRTLFDNPSGSFVVGASRDGMLCAARRGRPFPRTLEPASTSEVVCWLNGVVRTIRPILDTHLDVDAVWPHPAGALLVTGGVPRRGTFSSDRAFVVSWDGEILEQIELGFGVDEVGVTSDGAVWVTYTDEGIVNDETEPDTYSGLLRFEGDGPPSPFDWRAAGVPHVTFWDALNVAPDDAAWAYVFPDGDHHLVLRVDQRGSTAWRTDAGEPLALGVDDGRVLLVRPPEGNQPGAIEAVVVELNADGSSRPQPAREVVDDRGVPLARPALGWGFGVGSSVYLLRGPEVLCINEW